MEQTKIAEPPSYPAESAKKRVSSIGGTVLFSAESANKGLPSGRMRISTPPCGLPLMPRNYSLAWER